MCRLSVALVVILAVTAGCSGLTEPPSQPSGTAFDSRSGVDIPQSAVTVTVTAVVDGDTIQVAYENGTGDTVRLVGVDTPEVHVENDPAEFEGIPETDAGTSCLRRAGVNASSLAKQRLLGETVGLAFDPNSDRRGYYDRLLAYVVVDETLFNYRLVETGHARVYDSEFKRAERFDAAEDAARSDRRGLWRCTESNRATRTATADGGTESASSVTITEIHADAAGNDNENLNDEYVTLTNTGDAALDLSGWTVSDAADHQYTFTDLTLAPSASVTLYTGSGTDTDTERHWGRTGAIWNNDGDTVVVENASGETVLRRSY